MGVGVRPRADGEGKHCDKSANQDDSCMKVGQAWRKYYPNLLQRLPNPAMGHLKTDIINYLIKMLFLLFW